MFHEVSAVTRHVRNKIAAHAGVESVNISDVGGLEVVLGGGVNRPLREAILDMARNAMIPVSVSYRMPSGQMFEESKESPTQEWVADYYTPLKIPGFAGEPVEAPPEEVAAEPKGALKLSRIRSKTRGRPVVAWRIGGQEVRAGTQVKFAKEACLQWTMGRTITIKPGASANVSELSSRRPIAFIKVGEYDQVELPIHMLGHAYNVDQVKVESVIEAKKSKMSPELKKIMIQVGMGGQAAGWDDQQGRRRNPDDVLTRLGTAPAGSAALDDDINTYEETITAADLEDVQ